MLASNMVSHIRVTIEASEPEESERSGNWNMLTVSLTQSGYSVKKWIPRRSPATLCVTWGYFHRSALELSLHTISKVGRALSFARGGRVYQISGRSSGPWTLVIL